MFSISASSNSRFEIALLLDSCSERFSLACVRFALSSLSFRFVSAYQSSFGFGLLHLELGLVFPELGLDADPLLVVQDRVELRDDFTGLHIVSFLEIQPDDPAVHMADDVIGDLRSDLAARVNHVFDIEQKQRDDAAADQQHQRKTDDGQQPELSPQSRRLVRHFLLLRILEAETPRRIVG